VLKDLIAWNLHAAADAWDQCKFEEALDTIRPVVVVLDPLNAMFPKLEEGDTDTGYCLSTLREWMRKYKCTFIGVHHAKKRDQHREKDYESLETTGSIQRWFTGMPGVPLKVATPM
jgi:hypothetical protein